MERQLPFLAASFGGIVPTCELVEAGLHSFNQTDSYCGGSRLLLSDYCGCGADIGSQPVVLVESQNCRFCNIANDTIPEPDKTIDIVGFPFQTCGQLAEATETLFEADDVVSAESLGNDKCHQMRQLNIYCGPAKSILTSILVRFAASTSHLKSLSRKNGLTLR